MAMKDYGKSSPEKIVEQEMKGWTVVDKNRANVDAALSSTARDSVMPSTEELKAKWFSNTPLKDAPTFTTIDDSKTSNVTVRSGRMEKTVGVHDGKIIWRQG